MDGLQLHREVRVSLGFHAMTSAEFDVVVVGAGTAGANTAYQFAKRGRSVLLLDRRPANQSGAQWFNGVLDRHFTEAGLEPPSGSERGTEGNTVHLRSVDPRIGPTLHNSPTVSADMSMLGGRLRNLALDHGVELIDEVRDLAVETDPGTGRVRSVTFRRADSPATTTATADLFVDASGRSGVLRRRSPHLERWCPTVRNYELCSASDAFHDIADPAGAMRFLERHGAELGDTVTYVGVSGGYSTCAISISSNMTRVGILVGCLANGRYNTGPKMIAELCNRETWVGPAITHGSGVIPLRRPYARLTAPGVALVGDSACQVFAAHGSGIGIGLVAGTMLAEGLATVDDPGDEHHLWSNYQAPFWRNLGGDLAGYDVLRRATTRMGSTGVDTLIRSGIMDERTTRSGLDQRWAVPEKSAAARSAARLAANPRVARILLPALARAQALHPHAKRYPTHLDLLALARWERTTEKLLGSQYL